MDFAVFPDSGAHVRLADEIHGLHFERAIIGRRNGLRRVFGWGRRSGQSTKAGTRRRGLGAARAAREEPVHHCGGNVRDDISQNPRL